MNDLSQYKISSGLLSQKLIAIGIADFLSLTHWLQKLPYRRISDPKNISLVIDETCGTCSSKHILYAEVARENGYIEFDLIIGIYKMNEKNTPGIGSVIKDNQLDYIPEAHCYIRHHYEVIDVTRQESIYNSIKNDILEEIVMSPSDVIISKTALHKLYIKNWRIKNNIDIDEHELWSIREKCIDELSQVQQ
jgi:hypothetical protein